MAEKLASPAEKPSHVPKQQGLVLRDGQGERERQLASVHLFNFNPTNQVSIALQRRDNRVCAQVSTTFYGGSADPMNGL
jgi:hypothetical protein